ncbi:MAG: hypothetical protein KU37_05755 [Sulfuricurvum sp. PC08-66]|nr:MAG: hypothetical protein KU37_05755 [Sulfuricurvum sp. PC08-66]
MRLFFSLLFLTLSLRADVALLFLSDTYSSTAYRAHLSAYMTPQDRFCLGYNTDFAHIDGAYLHAWYWPSVIGSLDMTLQGGAGARYIAGVEPMVVAGVELEMAYLPIMHLQWYASPSKQDATLLFSYSLPLPYATVDFRVTAGLGYVHTSTQSVGSILYGAVLYF